MSGFALVAGVIQLARWQAKARRPSPKAELSEAMWQGTVGLHALLSWDGHVRQLHDRQARWVRPQGAGLMGSLLWQHPDWGNTESQREALRSAVEQAASGAAQVLEVQLRGFGAQVRHAELCLTPLRTGKGPAVESILLEARDITAHKSQLAATQLTAAVFEQAPDGGFIADAKAIIRQVNSAFETTTGWSAAGVIGQSMAHLIGGADRLRDRRVIGLALARTGHWQGELLLTPPEREPRTVWASLTWLHNLTHEHKRHLIANVSDISEWRRTQDELIHRSQHDALTGLLNRRGFEERLDWLSVQAARGQQPFAVLSLDLNQFREVNEHFGSRMGDQTLKQIALRLPQCLRDADVVARVGGDEFTILLPGADAQGASQVGAKLIEQLAVPMRMGDQEISITASIGAALFPSDSRDPDEITRRADAAMFRARQDGRSTFRFFDASVQQRSIRQIQLEAALHKAIDQGELLLHYQPQLCARSGNVVGLEALLRWHHSELGMISPGEFIPLAESSGQIGRIGRWVMREAARQMVAWMRRGMAPTVVAVNLSAVQFRDPSLTDGVARVLADTGLPPHLLELELTESVAADNPTAATAILGRLSAMGIRLAMDDFGTGYSSLSHLKRFRLHALKIDQSFVRDIASDGDDRAIVNAVIQVAHALGLQTVAEGVEGDEQVAFLKSSGADILQGYRFCRPIPAEQAFEWVQSHRACLQAKSLA